MRLAILSHKETWRWLESPSGYVTVGGFPFQMDYISRNFDETTLMLPIFDEPIPKGARPIDGHRICIVPLRKPNGREWRRKVSMIGWIPRHWRALWREVKLADAVHTPIGGDIGLIGIFIALLQRKRLFVRHCGNWQQSISAVDTFTHWLLEKIAGGKNVVMATGGGEQPPSATNKNIKWIFSTSLTEEQWQSLPLASPWRRGETLRLVSVGRLSHGKNVQSIIAALPGLIRHYENIILDIVGEGERLDQLKSQVVRLGLEQNVVFRGNLSHESVLQILAQSHIFVFPSFSEGFPKAVVEAMACRLPVVVSRVSVLPSLIGAQNGVLLDTFGDDDIVKAILDLMMDERKMETYAINARQASQQYTLERWQAVIGERLQAAWGQPLHLVVEESNN